MVSASSNPSLTSSLRKMDRLGALILPSQSSSRTVKSSFKLCLADVEKALSDLSISGVKEAIGGLLSVIKRVEVGRSFLFCPYNLNRGVAIKKANKSTEALKGLEAHLRQLMEAILVPLKGKEEAAVSFELSERIEKLLG